MYIDLPQENQKVGWKKWTVWIKKTGYELLIVVSE